MSGNEASQLNSSLNQQELQAQYQNKVQQQIKQKTEKQQEQSQLQKVTKGEKVDKQALQRLVAVKDDVQLSTQFNWKKDKDGSMKLDFNPKKAFLTKVNLKSDGTNILRILGFKIDYSDKVATLKDRYMDYVVQARSHNFLLAKYGQFKVDFTGYFLSILGVTQEEIRKLQKKAITNSVKENIGQMEENIYNVELMEIIGGENVSQKKMALFQEIIDQLTRQMQLLGEEDYYNEKKILEIRLRQCSKILDELNKEDKDLQYQYDYIDQVEE
jgi:hypothetical protein